MSSSPWELTLCQLSLGEGVPENLFFFFLSFISLFRLMQLLRPVVAVQLSVAVSPDLITISSAGSSVISGGTGNTNIFTN